MLASHLPDAISPEAYLAMERAATEKSEFVDGRIVAMSGASYRHVVICRNLTVRLFAKLQGGDCDVLGSDMRVRSQDAFFYPDLSVVCGPPEVGDPPGDNLTNPTVIFEVLSPSTESYDRTVKFRAYRRIPSLRAYVLVAQDRAWVDCFRRHGDMWVYTGLEGLDGVLDLPELGCGLSLAEIYERVEGVDAGDRFVDG